MLNLQQTLRGHTDRVWTLAWNPSGTILASSGGDKVIRLWACENELWQCISILSETHNKSIRRLCWSPCGQYIASASFDATICIWKKDLSGNTWSFAYNLEGHESEVKSVAWSCDGNFIASCGRDRTVWVWARATSQELGDDDQDDGWDCSDIKSDHNKDVKHVVWHPKHNILASCSYDDTIKLYHQDSGDWRCFQTLASHNSTVWSADFSSCGKYLVTCGDDKTVRVWKNHAHTKLPEVEPNSWKCISVLQGYHSRAIYDISWSPLSETIVSGSGDNSLAIYGPVVDENSGEDSFVCLSRFQQAHDCDVNSVAWNPQVPSLLATASDDRTIKLWKYNAEKAGTRAMSIADEILNKLTSNDQTSTNTNEPKSSINLKVDSHSSLLNQIYSLQILQAEYQNPDTELVTLEKLFDLKTVEGENLSPVMIDSVEQTDVGLVETIRLKIVGHNSDVCLTISLDFSESLFKLKLPKRCISIIAIAEELFLCDKTGDLFKILPSGDSLLLLGHLFSFSDVKFIKKPQDKKSIGYIVSADRDEKIRISNYPDTFEIAGYCFGHTHLIRRIVVVDDKRIISVDQEDIAKLWNLDDLSKDKPLKAMRSCNISESTKKRLCLSEATEQRPCVESTG